MMLCQVPAGTRTHQPSETSFSKVSLSFAAPICARPRPGVDAQELICLWMCFKANVLIDGDRHQRHLQIAPAPGDGTIISVFLRRVFNVERLRLWANVIDRNFSLDSERSTIMRELSALIAMALREKSSRRIKGAEGPGDPLGEHHGRDNTSDRTTDSCDPWRAGSVTEDGAPRPVSGATVG